MLIQRSASSSASSSCQPPGAQRISTPSAAKAARAQAMSSSQGVASLSSSRLCHLPTAFGSQVTGMVPAWHLNVLPFCCQGEQGPMAWVSQSVTACWLASLR